MVDKFLIKENELDKARIEWGEGIIAISKAYEREGIGLATTIANEILENLYGFEFGPILFKPTLSGGAQTFRSNREGTLSYFIGNNSKYSNDTGFGIRSWRVFDSKTSSIFVDKNIAMWMGWVTLTNKDGETLKVDKSWGYKKATNGSLKIVLHHSSIPYEV
tara:strand:+ start:1299 stop:1784 length:486 start_codon:yes stop_codon:yes gene_type:complete